MKSVLAIACVMIGSPAVAADLELNCKGDLFEGRRPPRQVGIEFVVSISGKAVTLQVDPKYGLGGPPLAVKRSNSAIVHFESIERSKNPGWKEKPRTTGMFFRTPGRIIIEWLDDEARRLVGDCEFLVGTRTTVSPKVT